MPSLSAPTPELVETMKEAAAGYVSLFTEYLASYSVVQLSLQMAERSLGLLETAAAKVTVPESSVNSYLSSVRRSVRAAKRAGARRNLLQGDSLSRSGFAGRVASTLHLNALIGLLGLELVPATELHPHPSETSTTDEVKDTEKALPEVRTEEDLPEVRMAGLLPEARTEDLPEAKTEDLHADMSAYRSEEDPDFVAGATDEGSSSESDDSAKEEDSAKDEDSAKEEDEVSESSEVESEEDAAVTMIAADQAAVKRIAAQVQEID